VEPVRFWHLAEVVDPRPSPPSGRKRVVPLNMAMALIVAMVMTNTVVLVRGLFDLGERETAIGMAAFGIGVLVRAILMVPLLLRLKALPIMLVSAAFAAGLLLVGTQLPASRACSRSGGCSASDTRWPSRLPQSCFAVMAALKIAAFSMPRTSRLPSSPIVLSAGSVQRSILRLSLPCSRRSQGPSVLCAHQGAG
jgi:hypothetical protein